MELRHYSEADLWLTEALEADPDVMKHLGGPVAAAEIARSHRRRAASAKQSVGYFTIWPDGVTRPVGTVGICVTQVHAFPSILNAPSNAICRKFGFALLGECTVSYLGTGFRSNHWCLDLRAPPDSPG